MKHPQRILLASPILLLLVALVGISGCGARGSTVGGAPAGSPGGTPAGSPTLTLTASPNPVAAGGFVTLNWTTTNATSIQFNPSIPIQDASLPMNGSASVPVQQTTTFTGTATGPGGSASQSITVNVTAPAPTLTFNATPAQIQSGGSTTLAWTTQNATGISIDQGVGNFGPTGQVTVSPQSTTTYTATATGPGGSASQSARVTVVTGAPLPGLANLGHIIFFVQENRSFDSYFGLLGQYKAAQGLTNDVDGVPLNIALRGKISGTIHPYHYRTVCTENLSPSWNESHFDYDNGKMDNFPQTTYSVPHQFDPNGQRAMGYYDQSDLPYYYELATQFATSDRWFSPVLANTVPNRMYLFAATSFGNIRPPSQFTVGQFSQPTIFDALDQAGIPWRYYYQDSSVFLAQWATWTKNNGADQGKVRNINEWYTILSDPNADKLLAPVVFIERGGQTGLDEHPLNNVQKGAANTKKIVDALMNSAAWPSSVFILTFDEGGGLYDHVPPFSVPSPDNIPPNLQSGDLPGDFTLSGFRVPLIVISPWVKPQFVSHVPRDFTAILKLIETRFNVPALTARDAAQDDMTEFFDFSTPALLIPPPLPAQLTPGTCDASLETDPTQ